MTPPGDYFMARGVAVNDLGAILAEVSAPDTTTPTATAVLSPVAAGPVVIQYTLERQRSVDIDDGTVLFTSDEGPAVWKDGELTMLPAPDGYTGTMAFAMVGGNFPATTWQDGVPAGALPTPPGLSFVSVAGVGDDGTVFGAGAR